MGLVKKEVLVIAAVEVSFGLIEGIVLPNIFGRKKGDPFKIPAKMDIAKTMVTLTATGFASGFISDAILTSQKVTGGTKRMIYVAGVSIAVNMVEIFLVSRVLGKPTPSLKEFTNGLGFLAFTALAGGFVVDRTLVAMSGPPPAVVT